MFRTDVLAARRLSPIKLAVRISTDGCLSFSRPNLGIVEYPPGSGKTDNNIVSAYP